MSNYILVPCIKTDEDEKIIVGSERFKEYCDNLKILGKEIDVIHQESYNIKTFMFLEPIKINSVNKEIPKYQKGQKVLYSLDKWGEFNEGIIEDVIIKEHSEIMKGEDLFFASIGEDITIEDAGLYEFHTTKVIYKIKGEDKEFTKRDLAIILNKQ